MESHSALFLAVILKCVLLSDGNVGELPHCQREIDSVMKHKCYDNGMSSGVQVNESPLKWNIIDSNLGRVKVEFPLHSAACTEYLANLLVYEDQNLTKDECSLPRNISYSKAHSFRFLSLINNRAAFGDDPPVCTETGSVTFNYIYTGCYTLEVGCVNRSERFVNYVGNYLETNYEKERANYSVQMSFRHFPATNEAEFLVTGIKVVDLMRLELYHNTSDKKEKTCHELGLPVAVVYMRNEEVECSTKVQNQIKPKCTRRNSSIKCMVQNVTEGYYCIMLELFDDRCRAPKDSVWDFSKCYYHSKVEKVTISPISDMSTIVQPLSSEYIVTGMVSSIFIILCLGVLFYMRMKRTYIRNPVPSRAVNGSALSTTQKFQILLLYPRDCEPLMKVMATFREILKERTQCEVYDVFDEQYMEVAAQNASCWILKYISNPNVKIVVLENECSTVIQEAYLRNIRVVYKEPMWMDDLFRLGLAALMKDFDKTTMYKKVFVIRFHGFNAQNDVIRFLVPNTRYTIPQHLNNLRSSLFENQNLLRYDVFLDDCSELEARLKNEIENLTNFKSNNPTYLETLLGVR